EPADATRNVGCAGRFRRPGAHPDYRPQRPIPRRFPGLDCAIRAYAVADGSPAGTTIIPSDHARPAGSALAPTPSWGGRLRAGPFVGDFWRSIDSTPRKPARAGGAPRRRRSRSPVQAAAQPDGTSGSRRQERAWSLRHYTTINLLLPEIIRRA